ncbi:hypothetical protein P171DRAFT_428213 [Karstenula rhodostoma CBS 690.94]|uniref:Zn(2)-C6 fungal-type domain-containing protein n=1 Tax=Karstenula rhodostoma CBS 690.94 TaxID=1392251 RepID=A0A9P4UFG5_9PLEO|nr:hypothetical protein P171DRAFT_428213 [Karstenula rhodostoma CBS 690.94]
MGRPATGKRSCGTCKDRKILCDRTTPACSQCTRAKRECKGYGLRLSWPRENDARRAILMSSQHPMKHRNNRIANAFMVRATHWDIDMYMFLSASASRAPVLYEPVRWNPHEIGEIEWDLLNYFQLEASRSLTIFGSDPKQLTNFLMCLSQNGKTQASTAVLHSMFGLASLYRYGWNAQAMEFKISSLRALAKASETFDESVEGVHHVAAGMLLCSFEVHMASCSASEWTWYVNGIKELLYYDVRHQKCTLDVEKKMLMNWLYYHDVMKQFSIRHWQREPKRDSAESISQPQIPNESSTRKLASREDIIFCGAPLPTVTWIPAIIKLMSELCDTVPTKPFLQTTSADKLAAYANRIKILDWRIRNIPIPSPAKKSSTIGYLYQLAMLIYLNRVTENILQQASRLQEYIDDAFAILAELDTCKPHFPMYIIGWEARTEEQRVTYLEMLERTRKDPSSRSLFHVEALVQAGWTQDDLAEVELNYWDKVTALVSVCSTMPSFV